MRVRLRGYLVSYMEIAHMTFKKLWESTVKRYPDFTSDHAVITMTVGQYRNALGQSYTHGFKEAKNHPDEKPPKFPEFPEFPEVVEVKRENIIDKILRLITCRRA